MKHVFARLLSTCIVGFLIHGQFPTVVQVSQQHPLPEVTLFMAPTGHSQRVHHLIPTIDAHGKSTYYTNAFVWLESGLNYLDDNGVWQPSDVTITVVTNGAIAWNGQHRVTFGANLNAAQAIQLRLPDGQLLVSHVAGLSFFDSASGQSVMIAPVKDNNAWVLPPNQVLYVDAFEGISADVRYTYTKAGFEQDVILRSSPPTPESYGLNSSSTRLEVWTEFISPPQPNQTATPIDLSGIPTSPDQGIDTQLDFGSMRMGSGKAFVIGSEDESLALVAKSWVQADNRTFLVEAVALAPIESELQLLPAAKGGAQIRKPVPSRLQALREVPLPPAGKGRGQVQSLRPLPAEELVAVNRKPGVVLDYSTINSTLTNYTFQSDTTYYISGLVTLSGTNTTFEGGTVLKYANTNAAKVVVNTPVSWGGAIYRPVVMTASDDSSIGEKVGTNSVSGYYADTALDLEAGTANTSFVLSHLRIANAKKAIVLNQKSGHIFSHVQLVNCQNGINPTSTSFNLRNALFYNVLTNFNGSSSTNGIEHLTVDTASWFNYNSTFLATNLTVTNSLLIAVTNAGSYTPTSVSASGSLPGLFQTIAGGSHYLASQSSYRNAGNTNINSSLAKDFKQFTTYPPTVWSTAITTPTTLHPQVQRDTDIPDLGYHYPALDYYASSITVTNTALIITNGCSIGFSGNSWIYLQPGSSLTGTGLAQQLNVFTPYSAVQEAAAPGAPVPAANNTLFNPFASSPSFATAPSISLQFTACYLNSPGAYFMYLDDGNFVLASASIRDCPVYGGQIYTQVYSNQTSVSLINDFRWRSSDILYGSMPLSIYNQLFRFGSSTLSYTSSPNNWTLRDNVFDTFSIINFGDPISYGNNAYITTNGLSQLTPLQTNDIVLASFTYATASNGLGSWYHGQTNLVDKGSRTADLTGLYHYTTQTSQVKETNSIVDIGFHYVAVDASGNPLDYDADGFPDYLEDRNGNGTVDSGETSWLSGADLGFKVLITEPKSNSNLP